MQNKDQITLPSDAEWVELTDDLLSSEASRWRELADSFDSLEKDEGREMATWLKERVQGRKVPIPTWVLRQGDRLLGFYAVQRAEADFSYKAFTLLELRRVLERRAGPKRGRQQGLLLSSIVRAKSTLSGFGGVLLGHAVGLALQNEANVAVFVEPANETVSKMWQEHYRFKPIMQIDKRNSNRPGPLWLPIPVNNLPECPWP